MADNSRMGNVSQVETYGKNLKKVEGQVRDVFKKLQQSTRSVGYVWDDDQFKQFETTFNTEIVRSIDKICVQMDIMANYVQKMVEHHRRAQQERINL